MLTVHHLNNSRSQRVLWLLEEIGVPYQIERYERNPETMLAPASLIKVHPLGKSPVVTDGKATLAESGAILEYLVETYGEGKFAPEHGTPSFLRYRHWMHYAEGSLATPLLLQLVFDQIERKSPLIVRPVAKGISAKIKSLLVTPNLKRHFDYLEAELTEHGPWFAGRSFSAADELRHRSRRCARPAQEPAQAGRLASPHPRTARLPACAGAGRTVRSVNVLASYGVQVAEAQRATREATPARGTKGPAPPAPGAVPPRSAGGAPQRGEAAQRRRGGASLTPA